MNDLSAVILQKALTARAITRADVIAFEDLIRAHPAHLMAKDFTVRHHFAPGVYMRELHIPAGMITIGKIHKYPCLAILAKGKRKTLIDGKIVIATAPHISLSPAGMKRASEALEDSVFITVHENPGNNTVIEELERHLACDTEEEYQAFLGSRPCLS